MAVQTIKAEIHIRRGTYDQLRKVYDPQNPDQSLSEGHPFQVMPGELAIAQDTNTLFFRLDDGQDPSYTKANTTQRLIEMPFQANDLKVSDRNAVTAGWRKLGTHSGSMFCAILTVVAGDGLWRCFVHRSGNAASVMSLDADPNAKISALKYIDTADGGEIWANVAADCTMYAEVVDETTNRGGTSSGWSFAPGFAASQTEPTGVGVNATGLPAQSDTSACHAVLQKADGTLAASENEPFEQHGVISDLNDAVLPGVWQTSFAQNAPSGRSRGSVLVTRSTFAVGQFTSTKIVQLYMIGGSTGSTVDAESELWIRDGFVNAGGTYNWAAWQRIDCDRSRLLPAHGWYFVSSADEFLAALADRVNGTAFDGVKNIWVLKGFTLTPDLSGNLSLALDCDVNVYGANVVLRARYIYSPDTALHTIRFFSRYIQFDGLGGNVNVSNVRLLIKRLLCPVAIPASVLSTGACVYYEADYGSMITDDTGDHPASSTYDPPIAWLLKRWDNTATSGGGSSTDTAVYCTSRTGEISALGCIGPNNGGSDCAPLVIVKSGSIKQICFVGMQIGAGAQLQYKLGSSETWASLGSLNTGTGSPKTGFAVDIPVDTGDDIKFRMQGNGGQAVQITFLVEHS